jgi:hypothetical protein
MGLVFGAAFSQRKNGQQDSETPSDDSDGDSDSDD